MTEEEMIAQIDALTKEMEAHSDEISSEGKTIEELQAAIDGLDRIDKALIMLYLDEKSYKEIAEIMDLTESNVGVKLNRIKTKLKEPNEFNFR